MRNPSCIHFPLWQCCGGVVQLHLAGWVVMISPDWPDIYPAFKPQSSLFAVLLVTIIIVENLENLNRLFSWPPQPHLLRLYLPAADDDQLDLVFSFKFYSERHIRMCERGKEGAFGKSGRRVWTGWWLARLAHHSDISQNISQTCRSISVSCKSIFVSPKTQCESTEQKHVWLRLPVLNHHQHNSKQSIFSDSMKGASYSESGLHVARLIRYEEEWWYSCFRWACVYMCEAERRLATQSGRNKLTCALMATITTALR